MRVVHLLSSVQWQPTNDIDRTPRSRVGWFSPDAATQGARSCTGPSTRRTTGEEEVKLSLLGFGILLATWS